MSNELISVEGTELSIKEYNGQRVVTFKDIDTVHQRPNGTARNAFNRNKKHFIKDVDYFALKHGDEQINNGNVRLTYNGVIPTKGITLLTESGYLMIVKAFTDELSWQVQRSLINAYFKQKEQSTKKDEARIVKRPESWFERNNWKMKLICGSFGWERKYLYHKILSELSEIYSLDFVEQMYMNATGHSPRYKIDLVEFYRPLQGMADRYIDYLLEEAEV